MDSQKIYLLAEVTVLPEFLDDVKGELKQALQDGMRIEHWDVIQVAKAALFLASDDSGH